jgi:hypothetical protein
MRTQIEQETLTIMEQHFPESGFPDKVIVEQDYIIIISRLCDASKNYQHKDYDESNFRRICVYDFKTKVHLFNYDSNIGILNAVIQNDILYFGTCIYGDRVTGQLFSCNIKTKQIQVLSDESRAVHWILKNGDDSLHVYCYHPTGYYQRDAELYHFNTQLSFLNYNELPFIVFEEDDIEAIINEDNSDLRLARLMDLLNYK